jgi:hypothetical protein
VSTTCFKSERQPLNYRNYETYLKLWVFQRALGQVVTLHTRALVRARKET